MTPFRDLGHLERLIAQERASIHAMIDERLVPLLVRRRLAAMAGGDAVADVSLPRNRPRNAMPERSPAPGTGGASRSGANLAFPTMEGSGMSLAESLRRGRSWSSARIVMADLEDGPPEGIKGRDLNARLMRMGHALDTAERTKTRLGRLGAVSFDASTNTWMLTDAYRASIPEGRRIVVDDQDRGRARNPCEQTGGRIVLDALAAGPSEGMPRDDLVQAVVRAGYSTSLGRHAIGALDMSGVIVKGQLPDTWKLSSRGVQDGN